jgi:hypothetical protein
MKTPIILLCGKAGAGKSTVADMLAKQTGFKVMGQADAIKELARGPFNLTQDQLYGPSESRNAVVPHLNTPSFSDEMRLAAQALEAGQLTAQTAGKHFFCIAVAAMRDKLAAMAPTKAIYTLNQLLAAFLRGAANQAVEEKLSTRWILQQLGTEVGRTFDTLIWTQATLRAAKTAIYEGKAPGVVVADGRFLSEVLTAAEYGATIIRIDSSSTLAAATHASEAELATIPEHFFDAVLVNDKKHGLTVLASEVQRLFEYIYAPSIFETREVFAYSTLEEATAEPESAP